jgi:hypothetical protein
MLSKRADDSPKACGQGSRKYEQVKSRVEQFGDAAQSGFDNNDCRSIIS